MAQTELSILLSARDEATSKLSVLRQEVTNLEKQLSKVNGQKVEPKTEASGLKELNNQLKGLSQFIRGRGDFMAINMIGREVAQLGQEMKGYAEKALAGTASGDEFQRTILSSIPVLGGYVRGLYAVGDAYADMQAAEAKAAGDVNFADYASDETRRKIYKQQKEIRDAYRENETANANAIAALHEGSFQKELAQLEQQHQERLKKLHEMAVKEHEVNGPGYSRTVARSFVEEADRTSESRAAAEDRQSRAETEAAQDGRERLKAMNAQYDAEQLREAGKTAEAEKTLLRQKYDAESLKTDRRNAAAIDKDPDNKDEILDQNDAEQAALKRQLDADLAKAAADAARDAAARRQDRDAKVRESQAIAAADQLRASKQFYAADLAELKAAHGGRLDEIAKQSREESLHKTAAEQAEIAKAAGSETAAENKRYGSDQARAGQTEHARQVSEDRERFGIESELTRLRIEGLKQESELGNGAAGVEARRLEIAEQYREKREQIAKILRDEHATYGEKAQAFLLSLGLGGQEAQAQKLANLPTYGGPAQMVGGDRFGGTGAGPQRREQLEDQAQKAREKQTDLLTQVAGFLQQLVNRPPPILKSLFGGT